MNPTTPRIETSRLILEPFDITKHLTARYVSWLNDPAVVKFSEQRHRLHSLASCKAFAESFAESRNHFWAIISKGKADEHIGNLVSYMDTKNRIAELSILIGEASARGCGLATEAWCEAIRHAFEKENMRKVVAGSMSENKSMLQIFSRSGMSIECRQAKHFMLDDREVDLIVAAIFSKNA
jgi:ribosomal-protein-alanine N-acetyltransferase